jgi:tetratricopeptide (TPR) repeat protein
MSRLSLLAAGAALVIAVIYVEVRLGDRAPAAAPQPPDLSAIEARLDRIQETLAAERSARQAPPLPTPLASEPPLAETPIEPEPAAAAVSPEQAGKVRTFLTKLAAGEIRGDQMSELWEILPASGLMDEAIAALKSNARAHPNDPDAQYGVGIGFISKLMGGQVTFVEQGQLSMMADQAFSQALKLDERHFGARYSKAISYTFWPDAYGKGPDAIKHFEILRRQSAGSTDEPMLESVYTNLGVQYLKAGNPAKAREALIEGVRLFPDSRDLKGQLEAMGD